MSHMEQDKDRDELSLHEFKNQFIQFRTFLQATGGVVLRTAKRYFLLFLLLFAVAMGAAYYQYIHQRFFKATASYVINELTPKTYGEMLDKLQDMILSGSYGQVASELNISLEQASSISAISAQNIYGSKSSEDMDKKSNSFYVTVTATNNKVFAILQPAIEAYLNNNILTRKMVQQKVSKMEQRLAYLKNESAQLDSLKAAYTRSLEKTTSSVSPNANPFNPVQLYERSDKNNQEMVEINILLQDQRAVVTADKFLTREHAVENSLPSYLVKYFLLFLATSLFVIFLISLFTTSASTVSQ